MPRKNKNVRKHGKVPAQNCNTKGSNNKKQNKQKNQSQNKDKKQEKIKLRTSKDVYNRLWNDYTLNIPLDQVFIGYSDGKYVRLQEMMFTNFELIDNGGDVPLHRIMYFRYQDLMLWDREKRLDRLWGSGDTKASETWSVIQAQSISESQSNTGNDENKDEKNDGDGGDVVVSTDNYNDNYDYNGDESQIMESKLPDIKAEPNLRYLIVLDFEATCDGDISTLGHIHGSKKTNVVSTKGKKEKKEKIKGEDKNKEKTFERKWSPIEIIEWPAMIIDIKKGEILQEKENIFHYYIKPRVNPNLTQFCTCLTGITQSMVDEKNYDISHVYYKWIEFCDINGLTINNSCIVTCGDWDLLKCWIAQRKVCQWPVKEDIATNSVYLQRTLKVLSNNQNNGNNDNINTNTNKLRIDETKDGALLMNIRWINIKNVYHNILQQKAHGMVGMLKDLKLSHVGRHHSGIDDVRNICQILLKLMQVAKDSFKFRPTYRWSFDQTGNYKKKKIQSTNYQLNQKHLKYSNCQAVNRNKDSKSQSQKSNINHCDFSQTRMPFGVLDQHCTNALGIIDKLVDSLSNSK